MMKVLLLLILCCATVAVADDFKLISGKEYKDAVVTRVEPDGIVLKTKSGISKVYFVELPNDVQQRMSTCAPCEITVIGSPRRAATDVA